MKGYLLKLRKAKEDRINAIQLSASNADGTVRDLSTDEAKEFDSLVASVQEINGRLAALDEARSGTAGDDDEDGDDEASPVVTEDEPELVGAGRSRNGSRRDPVPSNRGRSPRLPGVTPGSAPAVHTTDHKWSMLRALRLSFERQTNNGRFDGVEAEIHQELLKRRLSVDPPEGILIPLGNEPEFERHIFGKNGRGASTRDLTTSTGSGAVFVTPELPFIDLLRNKMILRALGARFLTGLNGKVTIPRQNAAGTAYWVAEGVSVSASNPTMDSVPLVNKTLGAMVNISRKFLYQASVDAEQWVRDDMSQVIALELDRAGINGSGSGAVPTGILQKTGIQTLSASLQGGTNGAQITFAKAVAMESLVATNNADTGKLKYLTTPGLRGSLKTTVKAAGQPVYIFDNNEINGYPALASAQVPSNLTKGTSSGICHALIFANWDDLIIATWGGIDTVVNPYTGQASGQVTISMLMEADVATRHDESFAIITDALP
jgi:HK97 family phage major capsid protein